MHCYQASDQNFGVCSATACVDEPTRCGELGRCLISPDACAPTCAVTDECPSGMTCTHEGVCVDCLVYPSLCVVPDAGPGADAGIDLDAMTLDSTAEVTDAGPVVGDASAVDSGTVEPSQGSGCSCSGSGWAGLWYTLMFALLRRRRVG